MVASIVANFWQRRVIPSTKSFLTGWMTCRCLPNENGCGFWRQRAALELHWHRNHCRRHANACLRLAETTKTSELSTALLSMAQSWAKLADDTEHETVL